MRSPQEHLELAEYYIGVIDTTWKSSLANSTPFTALDEHVNVTLLHVAEVHIQLAHAGRSIPCSDHSD